MAPSEVRTGTSRGRCNRLWMLLSRVIHFASMNGYSAATVNIAPGMITPGTRIIHGMVWPQILVSHAGIRRSEPSRKPRYQSGCEPADTWEGLYGPYSHTGLIWAMPPSSATTANTIMKKAPPLIEKYGTIRTPTTFWLVLP